MSRTPQFPRIERIIVILLAIFCGTMAFGQWPNGYNYAGTIAVKHALVPNSDQSNFAVLVSGTYPDLATTANGGKVTSANGYDIIFTSDANGLNKLNFERQNYSATGQVAFWVQVPALSHNLDTVFYVFYGNSAVTSDQSTRAATWDSNYLGVWHLESNPAGSAPQESDSTAGAHALTAAGAWTPSSLTPGEIGNALTSTYFISGFSAANPVSLSPATAFTLNGWIKVNNGGLPTLINQFDATGLGAGYSFVMDGTTNHLRITMSAGQNGGTTQRTFEAAAGNVNDGNWHQVAVTYTSGPGVTFYVDGAPVAATTSTAFGGSVSNASAFTLIPFINYYYVGSMDEARVSGSARSADWIATEYNNQSNPGNFYTTSFGLTAGGVTAPALSATPLNLTYTGTTAANPGAQSFAITNAGGGTLNWTGTATQPWIMLATTANGTGSSSLTGSGPQTIYVQVTSTTLAASATAYSGSVTLSAPGATPASQTINVSLTVSSTPIPTAGVSPPSLSFNNITIGSPSTQSITLSNTGGAALNISSIAITGTGFAITGNNCGSSLGGGGQCAVMVTFTPTATPAVTGSVTFTDNSSTGSTQTVTLSGTGATATTGLPLITSGPPNTKLRNDYAGFVGMRFTVGATPVTVTQLGRWVAPSSSQTHIIKLVSSTGVDVAGGALSLNLTGAPANAYAYAPLVSPITLSANTAYYLVTGEVVGGDSWYDYGAITAASVAAVNSAAYQFSGAYYLANVNSTSYGPPNFLYQSGSVPPPPTPPTVSISAPTAGSTIAGSVTVTASAAAASGLTIASVQFQVDSVNSGAPVTAAPYSITLNTTTLSNASHMLTAIATDSAGNSTGSQSIQVTVNNPPAGGGTSAPLLTSAPSASGLRNDFAGFVGFQFTVGSAPLPVTQLGRWVVAGNSQSHIVKLVSLNGVDVAGGSVTLSLSGATAAQYAYAPLAGTVTLAANTTYFLVTQEFAGGDQWYQYGPVTVTTGAGVVNSGAYQLSGVYYTIGTPSTAYGTPNLLFGSGGSAAPPALSVGPTSLTYSGTTAANPAAQSIVIANSGSGSLSWNATANQSWITLSTTANGAGTSSLTGAAPQTIYIQVASTALTASATPYAGTVTINAPGATPASVTVNVSLTVSTPAPILSVTPTNLSYSGTTAANPVAQAVAIANTGAGTLNWSATATQPWIMLSTTATGAGSSTLSGTAPQTIYVQVASTSLAASATAYTGAVNISAPGATPSSAAVNVSLTVSATPVLSVTPANLSYSGTTAVNPSAQSVAITNTGGGTLSWTATATQPWITLSTSATGTGSVSLSGSAPQTIYVQVASTTLASSPTPYTGAVNVSAPGANPASQPVNVSLTVGAPAGSYSNGYGYAGTIAVKHALVPNSDQSNFAVLVSGTYPDLATAANGGKVTSASGYDIIFTSDANGLNKLNFERQSYSAMGQVAFWVQVPALSHNLDTVFYVFYGNSGVTSDQSTRAATWDSNYLGVWHLESNPAGSAPQESDSTAGAHALTAAGAWTASSLVPGEIGNGLSSTYFYSGFSAANPASLSPANAFTLNGWIKANNGGLPTLMNQFDASGLGAGYSFVMDGTTNHLRITMSAGKNGGTLQNTFEAAAGNVNDGNWHHVAVTYTSGPGVTFYVDGAAVAATTSTAFSGSVLNTSAFTLIPFINYYYVGSMDEARVSGSARSADWIATEYNNQSNPGNFYTTSFGLTSGGVTAPGLSATPLNLTYSGLTTANPAAQSFAITNSGGGTLNWTATATQPWMMLATTANGTGSSSLTGSGPQTIYVQVTSTTLAASTTAYSGSVTLNAPGATPGSGAIGVSLTVSLPPPVLSVTPTTLTYTGTTAVNPAAQTVAITNIGGSTLNWTATATQPWIKLATTATGTGSSSLSGTAPQTIYVTTTSTALTASTTAYTGAVNINAPASTPATATVNVSLTVNFPPAVLSVSPTTLTYSGNTTANPAAQSVAITNTGGGTLNWTATANQPWIMFATTANGTGLSSLSGTAPQTIYVQALSTSLAASATPYSGTFTINGTTVSVSLTVSGPPVLSVSPTVLTFLGTTAAIPPAQPVTISNNSGGSFTWTASANQPWITLATTPNSAGSSNMSGSGQTTIYVISASTLLASSNSAYGGSVTVQVPGSVPPSQTVNVSLNVVTPTTPVIFLTPSNLLFTAVSGGSNPTAQTASIQNSGGGTLGAWSATAGAPWVTVSSTSGSGPQSFVVSVSSAGLTPGTYTTTVTLSAPAATPSSQAINVSLVVLATPSAPTGGGQTLYNNIVLPPQWPPLGSPVQSYQVPSYITSPPQVIKIDVGRQLFVDDFLIQQTSMARTQHQPVMYSGNPILSPNSADSAGLAMPYSDGVWYDPQSQSFKMWLYCGSGNAICYATSPDGMNWTRPNLSSAPASNPSQVQTIGSIRDSDVVWMDLQDPNPANKYKLFAYYPSPSANMEVFFSPDGITWTAQPQNPLINSISDRTTLFWNPFRSVWVASLRRQPETVAVPATPTRPAVFNDDIRLYSESPSVAPGLSAWNPTNFFSSFWTGADDQDPAYIPGGVYPQLYNLDAVAYESVMVGMFSWFYPDQLVVELGTGFSRDGFNWVRPNRGAGPANALIPASNTVGTWNGYNTQSAGGGFLVVGDELWFYFSGRNGPHGLAANGYTGLAKMRRDGFYSMDAGTTPATLTTRPVQFTGKNLFVNVKDPAGMLQVQVLLNGQVVATSPNITADSTAQPVAWLNGLTDLTNFTNQPIQFQFTLTNGSLYSFWVSQSTSGASGGYVGAGGPGLMTNIDTAGGTQPPVLALAPMNLTFSGTTSANPSASSVNISNVGGGTLSWTATANQPWITLSTTANGAGSSSLSGTAPQAIYVQVASTSLAASATAYTGSVTINAPGATPASAAINISLTVSALPVLSATPASLSYSGTTAANPAAQTFAIANIGAGTLNWTATPNQPWITLANSANGTGQSSLSGSGAQTIYVQVATRGLGPALTYTGAVAISAPGAVPTSQTIAVSVAVTGGTPPPGVSHYASPSGSAAGDGTIGNPWDLQTALNQPSSVVPGDTIWLRAGTYGVGGISGTVFNSKLNGTPSAPIIVRQYTGEHAIINGGLSVLGSYTWYWGFEVANLALTTRSVSVPGSLNPFPNGFDVYAPGTKLINLTIHDTAQGVGFWTSAPNAEIYGCIIYNNGWIAPDRGHGHEIYTQNQTGLKLIRDNLILQGFGLGIQAYATSDGYIQNYFLDGNTIVNSGTLTGSHDYNLLFAGGQGPSNITVQNTFTYHTPADNSGLSSLHWNGDTFPATNITATNNYWMGGITAVELYNASGVTFTQNTAYSAAGTTLGTGTLAASPAPVWNSNTYFGSNQFLQNSNPLMFTNWQTASGFDPNSTFTASAPTGVWSFVRPNLYESGRANITIYNWDQLSSVAVDVSSVLQPGQSFVLLNAQNIFAAPVLATVYTGGTISIPMTGLTAAQPIGTSPTVVQPFGPQLGVFLLLQQ